MTTTEALEREVAALRSRVAQLEAGRGDNRTDLMVLGALLRTGATDIRLAFRTNLLDDVDTRAYLGFDGTAFTLWTGERDQLEDPWVFGARADDVILTAASVTEWDIFEGDGATPLALDLGTMLLFVGGVYQIPGEDFELTNDGTRINFLGPVGTLAALASANPPKVRLGLARRSTAI